MATNSSKSNLIEFDLKMPGGIHKVFWVKEQLGIHPGLRRGFYGDSQGLHTTFYEKGGMHHEVGGVVLPNSEAASPAFADINEAYQIGYSAMPIESLIATGNKMISRVVEVPHDSPDRIMTLDLGDYTTSLDTSIHLVRVASLKSFLSAMINSENSFMFGDNLSRLISLEIVKLECFTDFKLVIFLLSGLDDSSLPSTNLV
jgi:hypothetical protein